tara:strand:+ start:141 stop:560 length:420 start_codon:yes stop_codon:yes gene_type:complete
MTVKTETNFWKSVKKLLESGEEYLVSRLESYATPGFPDCVVFHKEIGFFTLELKVANSSGKVNISTFQRAWNTLYSVYGAPVFYLILAPGKGSVKLIEGSKSQELSNKDLDSVPGLYDGRLEDLDFLKLLKLPTHTKLH